MGNTFTAHGKRAEAADARTDGSASTATAGCLHIADAEEARTSGAALAMLGAGAALLLCAVALLAGCSMATSSDLPGAGTSTPGSSSSSACYAAISVDALCEQADTIVVARFTGQSEPLADSGDTGSTVLTDLFFEVSATYKGAAAPHEGGQATGESPVVIAVRQEGGGNQEVSTAVHPTEGATYLLFLSSAGQEDEHAAGGYYHLLQGDGGLWGDAGDGAFTSGTDTLTEADLEALA